jgi:putative tricarboxylic transport membrane protein
MIIRSDHVAGFAFAALGLAVIALSGDLPFGSLSFPGSGFLPRILAVLLVVFGVVLATRGRESEPLASIAWDDLGHAGPVVAVTAAATALYAVLGFVITIGAMLFALLVLVERKRVVPALVYSVLVTGVSFVLFERLLKAPLPHGPLGF